jgi:hypothetical protein
VGLSHIALGPIYMGQGRERGRVSSVLPPYGSPPPLEKTQVVQQLDILCLHNVRYVLLFRVENKYNYRRVL